MSLHDVISYRLPVFGVFKYTWSFTLTSLVHVDKC